jgi:DNA-binding transcriptional LysR family regulator
LDNLRADLNAVRVFAQVVEAKTFRGAARALGIPKSTVSVRIARLEDQLGERLLERTTRRLRLTEAGFAYHRRALAALETLRDAEQALSDQRLHPSGRLCVSATYEGGQFLFAPLFAEYARRYPAVKLSVVLADRRVDLIEEGIDVALRSGALPDSGLVARRLRIPGSMRYYASPAYLAARGTPRRPRDLASHDCLIMTGQSEPRVWKFSVGKKVVAVTVRPSAEANSFVVAGELAKAGLGIARLPAYVATKVFGHDALRPVLDAFVPESTGALHAVYPSARHLSPKVRAFLELLDEHAVEPGG